MEAELHLALIHYPVVNRNGETIGSAVTNLDLHDIARAARTYGVTTYWVVTPDEQQRELADKITGHWTRGYGGRVNPDRAEALSLVRICGDLAEVLAEMDRAAGDPPLVVATSAAGRKQGKISFAGLRSELDSGRRVLILLGTAWGLAPEIMERVDLVLPPLKGVGGFNHLSVRSAASIILDRLRGNREDETGKIED